MDLVIKGVVAEVSQVQYVGPNKLAKKSVVIEIEGEYPVKICVDFLKEKAEKMPASIVPGIEVEIKANILSNKSGNNWYTNVKGWFIKAENTGSVKGNSRQDKGYDNELGF